MPKQSHILLLVEDCPDDTFFMRYALKQAQVTYPLHVVTDGQQAVDYLSGAGKFANRTIFPLPTVIFLDLKLPLLSGFEVLAWMRNQPALNPIPVIILTGSSEDRDKERARELGAKSYVVKPPDKAMLRSILASLSAETDVPVSVPPEKSFDPNPTAMV
jgi:CheY-like chemotaxis protein